MPEVHPYLPFQFLTVNFKNVNELGMPSPYPWTSVTGYLELKFTELLTPSRIRSRAPVSCANFCFSPNSNLFDLLPVRQTEPFLLA
jgi:hypothetical protein